MRQCSLPCLNGISTPLNRPEALGRIEGLHPGVTPAALGYATMEGVALQFAACVAAKRAVGVRPERFLVVGGGTRSALWSRLLATVLDQPVSLPEGAVMAGSAEAARLALVAARHDIAMLSRPRDIHTTVDPDPVLAQILAPRTARFGMLLAAGG